MANTTSTSTAEETSILDSLLHPCLPLDTDGLPGLEGAPVVYDLILRDLREGEVLDGSEDGVMADLQDNPR